MNKVNKIDEKRKELVLYKDGLASVKSQIKEDVYTKEMSMLKTRFKYYTNKINQLEMELRILD